MSADAVWTAMAEVGWPADLRPLALGIAWRESSFQPTVHAHCPAGCCVATEVDAVGLMQINWPAHQEFEYGRLEEIAYNVSVAYVLYQEQGWEPWRPVPAANGPEVTTAMAMLSPGATNTPTGEPGSSLASDILAAPQPGQAPPRTTPGAQPVVSPPPPAVSPNYIDNPAEYSTARSGWDAVAWHYTNDVPYYSGYDAEVVRRLSTLTGG